MADLLSHKWCILRLDQVADIVDSLHLTPYYITVGIPMIRVTDINGGFLSLREAKYVSHEVFQQFTKKHKPTIGDLVISRVGTYGLVSLVNTDEPFCLGQNTALIVPKINPRYLYYCMQTPFVKIQIDQIAVGSTQKTISLKNIKELQIPIAPNDEIDFISHILGSLDDKMELNRQMNTALEAITRAIFKSWFVDFDPVRAKWEGSKPYGMDDETAALFPSSFENTELGEIPREWKIGLLDDVADNPRRGVTPNDVNKSTPYIGLEHMPRKSIALGEWGLAQDVTSTLSEKYLHD